MDDQPFKHVEVNRRILNQNSLNFADSYTNAARKQMFSGSHIAQTLVVQRPSQKIFLTGMEERYGETTYSVSMPERGRIIRAIPRYRVSDDASSIIHHESLNPETVVIYESEGREVGMFVLPGHFSGHTYFGFKYKPTRHLSEIKPGNPIDEGVTFLNSPNITDDGDYNYGKLLNTAVMSHPAVIEDGFMICEDVLPDIATTVYKKREAEWGRDEFPINLYGDPSDPDAYQCFPHLGQLVREDDILIAFRRNNDYSAWVDQSVKRLRQVNPFRDRCIYSGGGGLRPGRVVDIKIFHDEYQPSTLPEQMDAQVMRYYQENRRFYEELAREIHQLEGLYGKGNLRLKPNLNRMMVMATALLDNRALSAQERRRLIYKDNPLDVWRAEFVIEHTIVPNLGFKLSNASATKGVITLIAKREDMPVDSEGNSADIVVAPHAVVNRLTPSLLFEMHFGAAIMKATQTIRKMFGIPLEDTTWTRKVREIHATNPALFQQAWDHWKGLAEIISPMHHYRIMTSPEYEDLGGNALDYFLDGLKNPILSMYGPPENPRNFVWAVKAIENSIYRPPYGPVQYRGYSGKLSTTIEPIRIAPVHYVLLEKITDDGSAVASSKTQIHGFLAQVTNRDKYSSPLKNNPTRVGSETDIRNIASYAGTEAVAELMDRNNSVLTRREIQRNVISSEHPTQIPVIVDRSKIPYGGSKPLQILKNIALCGGYKYVYHQYKETAQPQLPSLKYED